MLSPLRTHVQMRSFSLCSVKEWSTVQVLVLVFTTSTHRESHPRMKLQTGSTRCLRFLNRTSCGLTLTVVWRQGSTLRLSQHLRTWLMRPSLSAPSSLVPSEEFEEKLYFIYGLYLFDFNKFFFQENIVAKIRLWWNMHLSFVEEGLCLIFLLQFYMYASLFSLATWMRMAIYILHIAHQKEKNTSKSLLLQNSWYHELVYTLHMHTCIIASNILPLLLWKWLNQWINYPSQNEYESRGNQETESEY